MLLHWVHGDNHRGKISVDTTRPLPLRRIAYVYEQGRAHVLNLHAELIPILDCADSLMIHAGGDTYADEPHLGGGGARMACGVVSS